MLWRIVYNLCVNQGPVSLKVAMTGTLQPCKTARDGDFHYYSQSGSRIPAVVMEVAIWAELLLIATFYKMMSGAYNRVANLSTPTTALISFFFATGAVQCAVCSIYLYFHTFKHDIWIFAKLWRKKMLINFPSCDWQKNVMHKQIKCFFPLSALRKYFVIW